jgi:hypothetical protein
MFHVKHSRRRRKSHPTRRHRPRSTTCRKRAHLEEARPSEPDRIRADPRRPSESPHERAPHQHQTRSVPTHPPLYRYVTAFVWIHSFRVWSVWLLWVVVGHSVWSSLSVLCNIFGCRREEVVLLSTLSTVPCEQPLCVARGR